MSQKYDKLKKLLKELFKLDQPGLDFGLYLNGRAGISPEMAIRLSIAFDTTAESWLRQQMQYDL